MDVQKTAAQIAEYSWGKVFLAGLVVGGVDWISPLSDDGKTINDEVQKSRLLLSEEEKKLNQTKDAVAKADRFEREVIETVDQFNRVVPDIMPSKMSASDLTTIVSDLATKANVKLIKTEPKPSLDKAEFYETSSLGITVEGTFSSLVMFLSQLSHVRRLMTFESLEIALADGANDLEFPRLFMNGVLVGYRYTRKQADVQTKPKAGVPNAKK